MLRITGKEIADNTILRSTVEGRENALGATAQEQGLKDWIIPEVELGPRV